MNDKHAKALRRHTAALLKLDWRQRSYQGRWVPSRHYTRTVSTPVTGEVNEDGTQKFQDVVLNEALQIRLNPKCGRAAYRDAKHYVHAA
jgi:hypothetical protein